MRISLMVKYIRHTVSRNLTVLTTLTVTSDTHRATAIVAYELYNFRCRVFHQTAIMTASYDEVSMCFTDMYK